MEQTRAATGSGLGPMPPKIGKYEIISELGKGATSAVYRAYDPFQSRQVAIKVVYPEALGDQEYGRRYRKLFVTEASLAGKLSHPHISAIYDAVAGEDASYIVMEYVDGTTLEQYTRHETLLPMRRIVEIIYKCAKALQYASNQGVIHRDIKPANILLAGESDIKITDFGAALTQAAETTQVSGIGSPAYMSPEQVKEQTLTYQTDIFSLGVVMYQLLTGRLPFQGANNYSMIYQIINVEPPSPIEVRPDIPPRIDAIVARALQRTPRGATRRGTSSRMISRPRSAPRRSRGRASPKPKNSTRCAASSSSATSATSSCGRCCALRPGSAIRATPC
jgi:serine/threonine protein kinase